MANTLIHQDHFVPSSTDPQGQLRLRERVRKAYADGSRSVPLLMVHGATVSSTLWDHPDAQWSWMSRLAHDGFHVYALDLRGYGLSTRPAVLSESDPSAFAPYARAADVQSDVEDAIAYISERHQVGQVDLLGGSWGSIVCGMFAANTTASLIRRLVLYAPIYDEGGTQSSWWRFAADPNDTSKLNQKLGAYRWVTKESLASRWDDEIPHADKTQWRSDEVVEALFEACIAEDALGGSARTNAFRAPNGTIADLFEAYNGRPTYKASDIHVPTLLVRGDHDMTSSRVGTLRLFDAIGSLEKQYCEIGNGAHFVILEHQSQQVHESVRSFLSNTCFE